MPQQVQGGDMSAPRGIGPAAGQGAARELRRQTQRFQPVLEISPTAFVIADIEGRVVSWNPAAEQLFGYSADEAMGRSLDDLVATTEELHTDAVTISERTARDRDPVHTIT